MDSKWCAGQDTFEMHVLAHSDADSPIAPFNAICLLPVDDDSRQGGFLEWRATQYEAEDEVSQDQSHDDEDAEPHADYHDDDEEDLEDA